MDDLIASRAPYTVIERPTLQRLLYIAHSAPSLQDLKLPSDTTIKRRMSDYYNELKVQVKEKLQLVPCLAYTADGWTTSNMKHSFLGVTAPFRRQQDFQDGYLLDHCMLISFGGLI
ncbi:hypothetical protein INT45_003711 [Circinella minor]|uniref:Uncharacterized protein n=1 Tax=Circinella minor TaxID=1195481 RepID=A0A8H7VIY6_9FUNG|nr:hypothetical protein INT45_003711 [Circinella minor]